MGLPFLKLKWIVSHGLGRILDRYRERHAGKDMLSGGIEDRRHDADHLAVAIDQRASRIAGIGGGIELNEVGEMAAVILAVGIDEFALEARNHAGGNRR